MVLAAVFLGAVLTFSLLKTIGHIGAIIILIAPTIDRYSPFFSNFVKRTFGPTDQRTKKTYHFD